MSIGPVPTYRALLEPALDAVLRPIKRLLLSIRINGLYRDRLVVEQQIRNGHAAIQYLDQELARLESDRRRL